MISRWDWRNREELKRWRQQAFISIDPGVHGYAMAWRPRMTRPTDYCHALEPRSLLQLMEDYQTSVIVLESQYVKSLKNAHVILELCFRSGLALGAIAGILSEREDRPLFLALDLFEVAPPTWQAHQRKALGKPKAEKGDALRWTLEHGEAVFGTHAEWQQADRKQREGMGSALGIGEWWRSLW